MAEPPLRVVFVNHTARMGGGEISLLSIVERIAGRGVDCLAVLGEDGPLAERLRAASTTVVIQPLDRTVRDRRKETLAAGRLASPVMLARAALAALRLSRTLRRLNADVVHTNSLKAHLLGGIAGRLARVPVVWHVRDHISTPYLPRAVVPVVRAAGRVIPRRVVAVSASAAATTGRRDTVIVHQDVRMLPEVLPRPEGRPPRVGLVGRIATWKGHDVFLEAAARLAPEFPQAVFVIAGAPLFGEEAYERGLRSRAGARDLSGRVEFLGFREDVWSVYRDLDVVVHASTLAEPYGNVVLEAMASGRALVAAAAGGVLELVDDGRTGLLVPPGDAEALAAALRRLLHSRSERDSLADAGRRQVEATHSSNRDVAALQALWREVASRDQRRRARGPR